MFCEGVRIKRHSGLRAAKHGCHIRSNTILRARDGRVTGEKTSREHRRRHGEKFAGRQSVYRLEPERRFQDDYWRLLAARETCPPVRVDARSVERIGNRTEKIRCRSSRFRAEGSIAPAETGRGSLCAFEKTKTEAAERVWVRGTGQAAPHSGVIVRLRCETSFRAND